MIEKRTNKNLALRLAGIIFIILLLVFLIAPDLIPFVGEDVKNAVKDNMENTFGWLWGKGSGGVGLTVYNLLSIIAVVCLLFIISRLLMFIVKKAAVKNRTKTVAGLVSGLIKYAAIITGIIWCLSIVGINMTAIFASVGVLGLIIGFGAQSLIEDIITGLFIIIEGQYNIGDVIILDDFRGEVEKIGVRTTRIVDAGGNVKIVNNSDIRNLQNRSNNLSMAICDIGISYGAKLADVEKIIASELPSIDLSCRDLFAGPVIYKGVQELASSSVILRFIVKVDESNIFDAQRSLNRQIKLMFDRNGIEIPFTQIVVHNANQ